MLLGTAATRRISRLAPVLCVLALVLSGCTPDSYPQTTLRPIADFARIGDDIQTTTFWWAVAVFVLVEGALVYAIFRFRGKPDDPEPKQVHGNTTIEIIWTVVPALILAAIAVPTVRGIFETATIPGADALEVQVIGHQWWWEFRYPSLNLTTANELHVPVGQTVSLKMRTATSSTVSGTRAWRASATSSRIGKPGSGSRRSRRANIRGSARSSAASSTAGWRSGSGRRRRRSSRPGVRTCRRSRPAPSRRREPTAGGERDRRFRGVGGPSTPRARSCFRPRGVLPATR